MGPLSSSISPSMNGTGQTAWRSTLAELRRTPTAGKLDSSISSPGAPHPSQPNHCRGMPRCPHRRQAHPISRTPSSDFLQTSAGADPVWVDAAAPFEATPGCSGGEFSSAMYLLRSCRSSGRHRQSHDAEGPSDTVVRVTLWPEHPFVDDSTEFARTINSSDALRPSWSPR